MRHRHQAQVRAPRWTARHALFSLLALGSAIALLTPTAGHAGTAGPLTKRQILQEQTLAPEDSTDRLIIKYRDDSVVSSGRRSALRVTTSAAQATVARAGMQVLGSHVNAAGAHVLRLDQRQPMSQLSALAQQVMASDPNVLYAEPDRILKVMATPNDPMYASQWHYFDPVGGLNLPKAWDLSTGTGVVVAVIDTGYRPHADLAANLVAGYDFISYTSVANDGDGRDADATDTGDGCGSSQSSWHGTHVAGTIAAVTNNGVGVAGVAYGAKVQPVRVLGCGGGYTSDIADGIIWAAGGSVSGVPANPTPARVLNLSLGGQGSCSTTTQNAINTARSRGAVVVVAAGNSNTAVGNFNPANCKGVITVAATGPGGGRAPYSNYGSAVDVAAPGGNMNMGTTKGVLSTLNAGVGSPGADSYNYYQGTSMATPHVAGAAALMLARNPGLTPDEVEVLLKSNTRAFPSACSGCGTGIVDAFKAVSAVFVGTAQATDVTEVEPNESFAQAQRLAVLPARVLGTIASAATAATADYDTYRIDLAAGATLVARLTPNAESNYDMYLNNSAAKTIASSVRGTGLTDVVSWKNTTGTTAALYLRIRWTSGGSGATNGRYTLEVAKQ